MLKLVFASVVEEQTHKIIAACAPLGKTDAMISFSPLLQVNLFSRIRLAKHFPVYEKRLQCVQARLQAISVLCKYM